MLKGSVLRMGNAMLLIVFAWLLFVYPYYLIYLSIGYAAYVVLSLIFIFVFESDFFENFCSDINKFKEWFYKKGDIIDGIAKIFVVISIVVFSVSFFCLILFLWNYFNLNYYMTKRIW